MRSRQSHPRCVHHRQLPCRPAMTGSLGLSGTPMPDACYRPPTFHLSLSFRTIVPRSGIRRAAPGASAGKPVLSRESGPTKSSPYINRRYAQCQPPGSATSMQRALRTSGQTRQKNGKDTCALPSGRFGPEARLGQAPSTRCFPSLSCSFFRLPSCQDTITNTIVTVPTRVNERNRYPGPCPESNAIAAGPAGGTEIGPSTDPACFRRRAAETHRLVVHDGRTPEPPKRGAGSEMGHLVPGNGRNDFILGFCAVSLWLAGRNGLDLLPGGS